VVGTRHGNGMEKKANPEFIVVIGVWFIIVLPTLFTNINDLYSIIEQNTNTNMGIGNIIFRYFMADFAGCIPSGSLTV
jgi:hypothetical protein